MKKIILLMAMVMLMLNGCSNNKNEQIVVAAPTQVVTEPTELGNLITVPNYNQAEAAITVPVTPSVVETIPSSAPVQTVAAIVITKHPSSETVSEGGRTWFITGAENETQITWEFFSPDGTMYSFQQAMSAHPGLILEILPEDTLGLRQIPASFSGWSARARYDGPGGTATTNRATITVRQATTNHSTNNSADPSAKIIETYRAVRSAGRGNIEQGISELVNRDDFLGYAKMDLDGNGVQELILATDAYGMYPNVIYEIYTIKNGTPEKVTQSRARERYYMLSDGRILMEGSSGAMYASWVTYGFSGASLTVQEQIWTTDEPHVLGGSAPYYYYSDSSYGETEAILNDDAVRTIEAWEWGITLPSLTPII